MVLFKTTMNYFLNPLSAKKVGKNQIQRGLGTAAASNALFNLMKMESIRIRIQYPNSDTYPYSNFSRTDVYGHCEIGTSCHGYVMKAPMNDSKSLIKVIILYKMWRKSSTASL